MKISVLGNIVDTEDIYCITPIKEEEHGFINFHFTIHFFNTGKLEIKLHSHCYLAGSTHMSIGDQSYYYTVNPEVKISLQTVQESEIYQEQLKKITTLRDAVIAYWSNNQSSIPKLEFI